MMIRHVFNLNRARFFKSLANSLSTNTNNYDVVIIGGGMVGFGFAAFAATHPMLRNRKLLLIEGAPKKKYVKKPIHNNRVVALTPISCSLLDGVNAWERIKSTRCQAISKMKVIENGTSASLLLQRCKPGELMGYIVENDLVISSLTKSVEKFSAESGTDVRPGCIDVIYDAVVEDLRVPKSFTETDLPEITFKQRGSAECTTVKASLLVGADGFKSSVRKAAGIHTLGWEHDQSAVIGNLNLGDDYDYTTAWQRFTETGPIAFLPVGPNSCSVTWSTTRSEAKRLMSLNDEEFVSELNRCMSQPCYRPSGIVSGITKAIRMAISNKKESFTPPTILSVLPGSRAQFPLSFSHCTFYHGPRVALIGDAAHRILPLSGQGVNMGFGDAACLATTINRAAFEGEDIADPKYLARFTGERQFSVVPMASFIEGIQAIYAPDEIFGGPLVMHGPTNSKRGLIRRLASQCGVSDAVLSMRGLGLDIVDACTPLKNFFVEAAVKGRVQFPSFR